MMAAFKALWKTVLGLLRQRSPVPLDVTGAVHPALEDFLRSIENEVVVDT